MKSLLHSRRILTKRFIPTALVGVVFCLASLTRASDQPGLQLNRKDDGGDVIVRGRLGGLIFGFEVDPNGTEGLLCEAVLNPDGTVSASVETFSQDTGRIIRVLTKSESQDDFIALGVAGSVGLVEHEQVIDLFHVKRTFATINPLANNIINGRWTPPINRNQIVNQVKPALDGTPNVAVYALSVSTNVNPVVFTSNLADNTFGPVIDITDPDFTQEAPQRHTHAERVLIKRHHLFQVANINTNVAEPGYCCHVFLQKVSCLTLLVLTLIETACKLTARTR
jgi:hypothetical protein